MVYTRKFRLVGQAALVVLLACGMVHAQDAKPAKKCKPKDAACTAANADSSSSSNGNAPPKSMNEQFPFPTEDSKRGSNADDSDTQKPATNGMPEMPTSGVPDPPAESEKPMKIPPGGVLPPGTSDASGSSSSSSSADDDDSDVAPTVAPSNAPVKAAPLKNYGAHDSIEAIRARLDKTRVPDDLKVGKYYMDTGNSMGAYLRFKDAVDIDPENPEAHFYLAEAASKLNKHDEAISNYQICLNLDPDGDHDKASRKALSKLGVTAK